MIGFRARVLLASAVALAAVVGWSPAQAEEFDIRAADNAVSLAVGGSYLNYVETDTNGNTYDSEKGWMPDFKLGVSALTVDDGKAPLRNLYVHLDTGLAIGHTNYVGALSKGTPFTNTTNDTIWTINGRVGRAFVLSPNAMVIPYGEFGYRDWDRNMPGVYGYDENYHNMSGMIGVMAQYSPVQKVVLTADGAFGYTFNAGMDAGSPFSTSFDLGGNPTWRFGGQAGYTFTKQLEAFTAVDYTHLSYGMSAAQSVGGGYAVLEPNSTTDQTTLHVGLAYHFF